MAHTLHHSLIVLNNKTFRIPFFNYLLAFGGDKGVWWRQGRMGNQMVETRAYAVKIMKMSMSFMYA